MVEVESGKIKISKDKDKVFSVWCGNNNVCRPSKQNQVLRDKIDDLIVKSRHLVVHFRVKGY